MNTTLNRIFWALAGYTTLPLIAPYYLMRMIHSGKHRAGLRQRLTLYSPDEIERMRQGRFIWFHTVSVGELQAARPLLQAVKERYPQLLTWVTTVTDTGQGLARNLDEVDGCSYLPLDMPWLCRRFVQGLNPQALMIFETELWPNLIHSAHRHGIAIALVNGRLSDRSFGNYRRAKRLFAPVLGCIDHILAQSHPDAQRFLQIGAAQSRVTYTGNLKFEAASPQQDEHEAAYWRSLLHIQEDELLLVAGSTFPGEERLLCRMIESLRGEEIPIKLLMAPRHIERVAAIVDELRSHAFGVTRRSQLPGASVHPLMLLDTIGELQRVYSAADMVFIGKSLLEKGGQNPLEPAAWGKPVVFGPAMQNFRDIAALLVSGSGAVQVNDADELQSVIRHWCMDQEARRTVGLNAQRIVGENQGALDRILRILSPLLERQRVE